MLLSNIPIFNQTTTMRYCLARLHPYQIYQFSIKPQLFCLDTFCLYTYQIYQFSIKPQLLDKLEIKTNTYQIYQFSIKPQR